MEDDEGARDLFSVLALNVGWVVATFATASEARLWDGWPTTDVLIADYNLPGMTGAELCRWVRKDHPHVHTILTSAVDPDPAERTAAHVYVDKWPLAEKLSDVLESLRAL